METAKIKSHQIYIYDRQEFLEQFNLVIDGKPYSLMDLSRPSGKEADYVIRSSDGKKFILAPFQPRDAMATGKTAVVEYKE